MKIAYVVASSFLNHPGILRRVHKTIDFFRAQKHEIELFRSPVHPDTSILRVFTSSRGLNTKFDAVLLRANLPSLKWDNLKVPVVTERHVFANRAESYQDMVRVVWENLVSNPLHWSRGLTYVTDEMRSTDQVDIPSIVLGNVSSLEFRDRNWKTIRSNRIGIAIASFNRPTGLDFLNAFALHNKHFDVRVVLNANYSNWQDNLHVARKYPALNFVETTNLASYISELQTWSCALGPLALRRKGILEAAPLKVRDYIALSIPCILPYKDTNLWEVNDSALLQGIDFSELNFHVVTEFIEKSSNLSINQQTFKFVSAELIEQKRLNFVEDVLTY